MSLTSQIFLTPRTATVSQDVSPPENPIDSNDWSWHDGEGGEVAHIWQSGLDAEWFDSPTPAIPWTDVWEWQEGDIGEWQEDGQTMTWQEIEE